VCIFARIDLGIIVRVVGADGLSRIGKHVLAVLHECAVEVFLLLDVLILLLEALQLGMHIVHVHLEVSDQVLLLLEHSVQTAQRLQTGILLDAVRLIDRVVLADVLQEN